MSVSRLSLCISFASDECHTWRTRSGQCCVFPYLYKGSLYHSCFRSSSADYRCSLTADYESDHKTDSCEGEHSQRALSECSRSLREPRDRDGLFRALGVPLLRYITLDEKNEITPAVNLVQI